MTIGRRDALRAAGGCGVLALFAAAGVITPRQAWAQQAAWNKAAFEAKDLGSVLQNLGGEKAGNSDKIILTAPDIAENGAVVPLSVATTLPNVTQIALAVEKNPNTLAAVFEVLPDVEPFINTRVKMSESSNVFALVKSDGRYYVAQKEVKVTLGGCGG